MIEMPSAPEVFNSRTGPEGTTTAGHGVRRRKKQLSFFPLYTLNMTAFSPDKPSNEMNIYCKAIKKEYRTNFEIGFTSSSVFDISNS